MIRFYKATTNHSNRLYVPARASLQGITSYSIAFVIRRVAGYATNRVILDMFDSTSGLLVREFTGDKLAIVHGDGAASTQYAFGDALTLDADTEVIITWDGSLLNAWLDGVKDSNIDDLSATRSVDDNTGDVSLGSQTGGGLGTASQLGHFMFYKNRVLTTDERTEWGAGTTVPAFEDLSFWHKMIATPGVDEIASVIPTSATSETGSPAYPLVVVVDAVDSKFSEVNERGIGVREALSRDLRWRRTRETRWKFEGDRRLLDQQQFADAYTQTPQGPTADGEGWTDSERARLGRCISKVYSPGPKARVRLVFRGLGTFGCWLWDSGVAARTVRNSVIGGVQGPAELHKGATKTATRLSSVFVPGTDGRIAAIAPNLPAVTPNGTLIQPQRTNYVKDSSFDVDEASTADWAFILSGSGTLSQDDETTDLLFDPVTTGLIRTRKVEASSLSGTAGLRQATTHSAAAATYRVASIDVKLVSGGGNFTMRIRRDSDSKWWNGSAWQVSETGFTPSNEGTTPSGFTRYVAKLDYSDQAATAQTHLIGGRFDADFVALFGHFQIENADDGLFASSRIVTTVADEKERRQDAVSFSNNSGARVWSNTRGGVALTFQPIFDKSDLSDVESAAWLRTVAWCHYADDPSGDWFRVIYADDDDGNGAYFGGESYRNGTATRAKFYVDVVNGTRYRLGWRWVDAGKMGRTDAHMRFYCRYTGQSEDPKGAIVDAASGFAVEATPSTLYYGPEPDTSGEEIAAGYVSDFETLPPVLEFLEDGRMLQT